MNSDLTVIKLGGSLLTDKQKPYSLKKKILKSVVNEIKLCLDTGLIKKLIIVHGVGSFGHPPVLEYKLHLGYKNSNQLIQLSRTQQIVNQFRKTIADEFIKAGVPINLFHASSISVSEAMKIKRIFLESLEGYLSKGMIPLIGGDMIFDRKMGWSVGSGDQIAAIISKKLHANNLIFASDVPGVFNSDPTVNDDAEIIYEIKLGHLDSLIQTLGRTNSRDASGNMIGKLRTINVLKDDIRDGLKVNIISMINPGNLIALLKKELKKCTKISVIE
jgi:isopentenyl phosphate kinase